VRTALVAGLLLLALAGCGRLGPPLRSTPQRATVQEPAPMQETGQDDQQEAEEKKP
jgi:predicted small lipoprotein YifL